jgi:hypothetical protein
LHQSPPSLYDIHLWPNSSNSSIDARPAIDIEPRRGLSLKTKPFEYRRIERYITFNHWLVAQRSPDSYIAGGVAINREGPRFSRDIGAP